MESAMGVSPPPPPPIDPVSMDMSSLFVGDLHPDVTEKELEQIFSPIGPLLSLRLFRSPFPNNSLSYAHINFSSPSHASKALASLNNLEIKGVTMKIMRNQTYSLTTNTGSEAAKLFVKNLHPSVTNGGLEGIFSKFGTILSCKVAGERGKNNGFGFVQFASEDSAISALNALHGTVFEGKTLYVSKFQNRSERKDCVVPQFTNLYVKNLPEHFTEDSLKEEFSKCGKVFNVAIMKDGEGKSKGFGFVNFESHEDAKKAIEALNGSSIGSKKLYVGRAQTKAERQEVLRRGREEKFTGGINLYVKNLDVSIDDSKLEEMFRCFGRVSSVKVMRHENGVSKGFGFVSFCNEEAGKIAMSCVNGSLVEGKYLYVGVAQRKEERRRELQTIFNSASTATGQQQFDSCYINYGCNSWDMFQQQFMYYNSNNNNHLLLHPPNPLPVQANYLYPTRYHRGVYTCVPARASPQIPAGASRQQQGLTTTNGWIYQVKQQQQPKQRKIWCKMESKSSTNEGRAATDAELGGGGTKKISEILLKMEKSKIQKILDNPRYLAMHVIKATSQVKAPCARQAQPVHYRN